VLDANLHIPSRSSSSRVGRVPCFLSVLKVLGPITRVGARALVLFGSQRYRSLIPPPLLEEIADPLFYSTGGFQMTWQRFLSPLSDKWNSFWAPRSLFLAPDPLMLLWRQDPFPPEGTLPLGEEDGPPSPWLIMNFFPR